MATGEEPRAPSQSRLAALLVVAGAAGLLLAPIWLVAYPPLLDYPNHLARAFVLAHLHDPAFLFGEYYRAAWGLYPYLGMDLSLLALQRCLAVELAGRVFLSICVLVFPLGAWFFLRQANPGQDWMALWALPATYNVFFLEGFLNFYLSLGLAFLAVGLHLRYLARPRAARWFLALGCFTALYFTHLLGFGIAALVSSLYCLLAHRKVRELMLTGSLFVPGALFYLRWWWLNAGQSRAVEFHSFADKWDSLSAIMHSYSATLDTVTLLAFAGYFLAAWWRNAEFRWSGRWLGVAAALFALYWALPWAYGDGSDLDIRVLPVVFILLVATARTGRRGKQLIAVAAILFMLRTADVIHNFVAVQPQLASLAASFRVTSANVRVLPIVESDDDPIRRPYTHFWAYGVIRRGWLSPYLLDLPGVTPLRVDFPYAPDGFWDLIYETPPDWRQVQQDYDYVWAFETPRFSSALAKIGTRVYSAEGLEVYRVNKRSPGP